MSTDPAAPLVWIDLETTGLEPSKDLILEIAMVITDGELEEIARYSAPIFHYRPVEMPDVVREMHSRSGLLSEITHAGVVLAEASVEIRRIFDKTGVSTSSPLCGSTVQFDRNFLAQRYWGRQILERLHYRNVDVSSWKEMIARWRPEIVWQKADKHRALDDIIDSIAELAWYRKHLGLAKGGSRT